MTQDQPTPGAASAGAADDPFAGAPAEAPAGPPAGAGPTPRAPSGTDRGAGSENAVDELDGLDDLPVAEHVARFTAVHDALRARLDGAPGAVPGAVPAAWQDDAPDAGPRR